MIARDRPYSGIQGLCLPCGFEFPLQAKGKEAAEDVAADGFVVAFMEDGTGFHDGLCRAEGIFDHPEHLETAGEVMLETAQEICHCPDKL